MLTNWFYGRCTFSQDIILSQAGIKAKNVCSPIGRCTFSEDIMLSQVGANAKNICSPIGSMDDSSQLILLSSEPSPQSSSASHSQSLLMHLPFEQANSSKEHVGLMVAGFVATEWDNEETGTTSAYGLLAV